MKKIKCLKCVACQKEIGHGEVQYLCPDCGNNLEVIYNYSALKKKLTRAKLKKNHVFDIWRYWDILPFAHEKTSPEIRLPSLPIGGTPLYKAENIGKKLGFGNLFFKDDTKSPSGSFKDRASSLVAVKALELKSETLTTASTGNAGCALACVCANLQVPCVIFVPETAPKGKIAQLMIFGAKVLAVKGNYDQAFDLSVEATKEFGWYCRSTGFNPYTREGKKTAALEICEQMNWEVPDIVFVAVGDGNMISGVWKGFVDFYKLGLIDRLPAVIGVQAEESNAVATTLRHLRTGMGPEWNGTRAKNSHFFQPLLPGETREIKVESVKATTLADSISVDLPRDGVAAVRAILESAGDVVEVSDQEILEAIKYVAETEGIFAEPAGATSVAGFLKMFHDNRIAADEKVVCLVSGNGLKDSQAAIRAAGEPEKISPDISEVRGFLKNGFKD